MNPKINLPDLITRTEDLGLLADLLRREEVIGVDTESNSLHAYQERVCLIQFSTREMDYLVDPLALPGLEELRAVFADGSVEKVFHAAEYDLICMTRDYGFEFGNLFDTMWAARVLGRKEIGLGALLGEGFGVTLDKRYQRANWGKRPMSEEMLAYARLDTHYLIPLRNRLLEELQLVGRLELAEEDFRRLSKIDGRAGNGENAPLCWQRINGTRDLNPQQMAVLRELCEYRERMAQRRDVPVFKVLGDGVLLGIAGALPEKPEDLKNIPNLSGRQMEQHGGALLEAVKKGLKAPPLRVPYHGSRLDNGELARLEGLRAWRKAKAQKMGVESDVILPREIMMALVEDKPRSMRELLGKMQDVPWRAARFGEELIKTLRALP